MNNPINLTDPDGRSVDLPPDRYKIDKEGNISYYDNKGGCQTDYLMDENGNEIKITDTNILPQLSGKNEDWNYLDSNRKGHKGSYAISDNFKGAKELFEFSAKASNVEWVLRKHKDKTFIGTNHVSDGAAGTFLSSTSLLVDIHSHLGTSSKNEGASGISLRNASSYNHFLRRNKETDLGRALSIYTDLEKSGKISSKNNYKGAPNFYIYRPDTKPSKYFQYDPWNTKL